MASKKVCHHGQVIAALLCSDVNAGRLALPKVVIEVSHSWWTKGFSQPIKSCDIVKQFIYIFNISKGSWLALFSLDFIFKIYESSDSEQFWVNESVNPNVKWSTPDCFKLWIVEGLLYIEKGYYVQYGSDVFNGQNFKSTFLRKHSGEIF